MSVESNAPASDATEELESWLMARTQGAEQPTVPLMCSAANGRRSTCHRGHPSHVPLGHVLAEGSSVAEDDAHV